MWSFIAKTVSLTQQGYKSLTVHQKVSVNGYFSSVNTPNVNYQLSIINYQLLQSPPHLLNAIL